MLTVCYLGAPHEASGDLTCDSISNLPDSLEGAAASPRAAVSSLGDKGLWRITAPTPVPSPSLASTIPFSASVALTGSVSSCTWCLSCSDSLTSRSIVPSGLGHVVPRDRTAFLLKAEEYPTVCEDHAVYEPILRWTLRR